MNLSISQLTKNNSIQPYTSYSISLQELNLTDFDSIPDEILIDNEKFSFYDDRNNTLIFSDINDHVFVEITS